MKQAILLLVLAMVLLETGQFVFGHRAVVEIAYGAITAMSLMISATFLWLWGERATPLALGMSFSWLGAGLFAGGFWVVEVLRLPLGAPGEDAILLLLAVCSVGAVLHFSVIHRSFGRHGAGFLWPVLIALGLSAVAVAALGA